MRVSQQHLGGRLGYRGEAGEGKIRRSAQWGSQNAYMLVNQQYSNVLSLLGKSYEGFLNLARLGLLVDDQEISLRVWRL